MIPAIDPMPYSSENYQRCKASISAAQKRYYEKNKERILARQKKYDDEHREEIKARQKLYAKSKLNSRIELVST